MKPVQKVLDDADLQKNQVDEIVLVGGSTRILKIQQLVKDFFSGKVRVLMLYHDLIVPVCLTTVMYHQFFSSLSLFGLHKFNACCQ